MIPWLEPSLPPHFPSTKEALEEPNGLLAAGGLLTTPWLLKAYQSGIFPWFSDNEPLLWWSPAPRTVLFPEDLHISRSFRKFLIKTNFKITINQCFTEVIKNCSAPRKETNETWICEDMIAAYSNLHTEGYAHSIECWDTNNALIGGLYGVAIGEVFFGESMFSKADNASKCCLKALVDSDKYKMIDCQMSTSHLVSLGAQDISRDKFESLICKYIY